MLRQPPSTAGWRRYWPASFFGGVALWVPVEKLFLAEIGFTPQTIGIMAAAYAAVVPAARDPLGHPRRPLEPPGRARHRQRRRCRQRRSSAG